ncbi:hypothetical protein ABPG74_003588 [Tetrahymena malaccensis]
MGSCSSINSVQPRQDVIVRRVKVTPIRMKQREEQKKQKLTKDRLYLGEDRTVEVQLDQFIIQSHLMQSLQRQTSTYLGTYIFNSRTQKAFQPMLKNLVLDYQEQFPKWLLYDEQFRNDQLQEFLHKCQETAKLQTQDEQFQKNKNESEEDDDEDEDDDDEDDDDEQSDDQSQNESLKQSANQINNRKNSKPTYARKSRDSDQVSQGENDGKQEDGKILSSNNSQSQIRRSSNNVQQQSRRVSGQSQNNNQLFTKTKSFVEEKSQISKKSAVQDSDKESDQDSDDEHNKTNMHKVQEISGMRRPSNHKNTQLLQKHVNDEENLLRSSNSGQATGKKRQSNEANTMLQIESKSQIDSKPPTSRQNRPSNANNMYVIKEYNIMKNEWIHSAICKTEIKTPQNLLEFKRRYFYEFDKMSAFLSYLLALKRQNFSNLLTFSYIQIGETQYNGGMFRSRKQNLQAQAAQDAKGKQGDMHQSVKRRQSLLNKQDPDDEEDSKLIMYIDRIFPECGKTLEEYIHSVAPGEDINKICAKAFQVFDTIANTLCKMHRAGFSYRVLKPSMVRIFVSNRQTHVYLDSPDFIWNEQESKYLQRRILNEIDYMYYDCKCLSALMVYYFQTVLELRNRRRDSNRPNMNATNQHNNGSQSNANSMIEFISGIKSPRNNQESMTSIQQITNVYNFTELVALEDQSELDQILEKIKLPQIAQEALQQLVIADFHAQKPIEEFTVRLQGVLEKGPQTAFKHDSLSAFLSYHGDRTLKNDNQHVYFRRKNQIHFYEFESKTFKVIKLIRKKAKFPVKTHLTFSKYDNCFYFFAASNSNKIVKIPLNINTTERHIINQKSEVIFFKSIKNMEIEDPQILTVVPDDYTFRLFVFNGKKTTDPETNDSYYNSYIVQVQYKQDQIGSDDWNEQIRIYEGPRNYLWRRKAFHFYDPHNKFIYCILDSLNIFERGIRYSYFDTSVEKGDFKDGNLRFACSTEDIFNQFCDLNMNLSQFEFCVEVQHGVFLLSASKNIYILDFNYKCFYSFSTLKQLLNFEKNHEKYPHRHQYAYEILNQPFEVKFNNALNLGKNVVFQEGMLHMLGRKEVETVICSYELLPTQGVMILKKCVSLHSFDDILLKSPKQLYDIWNFQEFKRVVYEKAAGVGEEKNEPGLKQMKTLLNIKNIQNEGTGQHSKLNGSVLSPTPQAQKSVTIQKLKADVGGTEKLSHFATNKQNTLFAPSPQIFVNKNGNVGSNNNFLLAGNNTPQLDYKLLTPMAGTNRSNNTNAAMLNDQKNQLSKQDEQNMNQFMAKLNYLKQVPSNFDGTVEQDGDFQQNQFKIISLFQQTGEYQLYRILHQSQLYNLRKIGIGSISEYEQFVQLLELNAQSKYLIQIKQCFLMQDDNTGALFVNIIEEDSEWSLLDELNKRIKEQNYFKSQELGTILKAIFKAVISLQTIELVHGNVSPRLIYFTGKGYLRLAGWYLENRETFQNDFIDACTLIYQLATLEYDENLVLTSSHIQENQEKLKMYPGLSSFLINNMLILQDGDNLKLDQISEDIKEVYQSLQVSYIKNNKDTLSSDNKRIFWIGYNTNYLISCHYEELTFCKNEVVYLNNTQYKFSKHNMFTFDHERMIYMTGSQKEDFKTQQQPFYCMDFSFQHQSKIKLRQLKDIPNSILQPSLYYCNDYVYCIGGYQIQFDGSKSISKKAYRYSIKTEDWEQICDMPIGVVSGTVLSGKDYAFLYVFGGVSEEVELRGRELNYLVYDIEFDEWALKVDLSIKSPFINNRYVKPCIDHIGNNIFVSLYRQSDCIYVQFFELIKGGINIKFKIEDERDEMIKEQEEEIDIFNDIKYQDYFKAYQDDLSFIFVRDTIYFLDEFNNALITLNFANFNNIKYDRTPCGIIANEKENKAGLDKQITIDRNTSIDSFYFNGY